MPPFSIRCFASPMLKGYKGKGIDKPRLLSTDRNERLTRHFEHMPRSPSIFKVMLGDFCSLALTLFNADSSALPLRHGMQPRQATSCTEIYPSLMVPVKSSDPGLVSRTSNTFFIEQEPDESYYCDCLVSFILPESPANCRLQFNFPNGYQGSPESIYFWNVAGPVNPACCWDDAPSTTELLGSVALQANKSEAIINAFICQSSLDLRVGMNRSGQDANCAFEQTASQGLILKHGC